MRLHHRSGVLALVWTGALAGCGEPIDRSAGEEIGVASSELSWPTAGADTLVTNVAAPVGSTNFGCWDVPRGSVPRPLNQWPCHARNHQLFNFVWNGVGFRIKLKDDTGLCLEHPTSSAAAEQRVQFAPCASTIRQSWLVSQSGDRSTIRPQQRPSLCLDVQWGVQVNSAPIWLYACNGTPAQQFKFHTKIDDDGLSCSGPVQFGGPAPVVQVNSYAAFRVTSGIEFNAHCDPSLSDDTVDCSDNTDLFVVDRANGAGGYTVRCFKTDADPPPPPPEPGCQTGHVCCSGGPASLCNPGDCAPSLSQCQ